MMAEADLIDLIRTYGLMVLAPLALLEGPIVSVLGGYLVGRGLIALNALMACLVIADVAGDAILYGIGRYGGPLIPQGWRARLGMSQGMQDRLVQDMHTHGTRILVIGKLTHAVGFAVLATAGAARYPFGRFLLVNFLATLPKSAALVFLGWMLGDSWGRADAWLSQAIAVLALVLVVALALWLRHRQRRDG